MKVTRRIKSKDMEREHRVPPGQIKTPKWPVLHYGPVPEFVEDGWDFKVFGLVENPFVLSYLELLQMDRVEVQSDIHCVTTWSKLDNMWEGISVHDLIQKALGIKSDAKFVIAHCEYGFTTNMPLSDFLQEDVLLALKHNGENLTPDHGFPLRLVVPQLYFWKSAKWIRALEFSATDKPGFWERNGYHNRGNPWTEERMWI